MIANYSHKWWYYAISVLLIIATLLFLLYSPFHRANALAATGVAIAAVLALLAAWGVTTIASNLTSSQLQDYVDGKMQEYAGSLGESVNTLFNNSLLGATATGLLAVGSQFVNAVRGFANWLITDESLNITTETEVYNNNTGYILNQFTTDSFTADRFNNSAYAGEIISNNDYCENHVYALNPNGEQTIKIVFIDNTQNVSNSYIPIVVSDLERNTSVSYAATARFIAELPNKYSATFSGYTLQWNSIYNHYMTPSTRYSNNSNNLVYNVNSAYIYNSIEDALTNIHNTGSLSMGLDQSYDIPDTPIDEDNRYLVNVGALEGTDLYGIEDHIIEGVLDNDLEVSYEEAPVPVTQDVNIDTISTGAISSIQSAVQSAIQSAIQQSEAIQVNTDHHILGFTLPSFELNLSGIWHYVHDAVGTASTFINFLKSMLTSVPWLAIPLYMSFTLIVVLGVFRRFLL